MASESIVEAPIIEPRDETILEAGMMLNIETPRFFVGGFGFNMEDPVLVTEDGCKRISTLPRELFTA
jgi:Xaa-Pro aminopeptidase